MHRAKSVPLPTTIAVSLLGIGVLSVFLAVPVVNAAGTPLSTWCSGSGLSYDTSTSTCTVTTYDVGMSVNVEISSGETLSVPASASCSNCPVLLIGSGTTLKVDGGGTITIANNEGAGIFNEGTIDNSGTITIENSGSESTGIDNAYSTSTITNECPGTINIANATGTYAGLENGGTINKYGTISGTVTEQSGGVLNDYSASCSSSGATTTSSTILASTTPTTSSATSTTTSYVTSLASSTTASTPTSSSGGGIPEFPFQGVLVTAITLAVIASYFVMRRSNRSRTETL